MARFLVVYRSTGRENTKPRPPWYSKRLCLLSFVRSAEGCPTRPEVVYLNDGAIPEPILSVMRETGELAVVTTTRPWQVRRSGLVRSYLSAMDLALDRLADEDLVYLAEDDYLFRPEALFALVAAADAIPSASYFGLYASILWNRTRGFHVGNFLWHTAESTTSSFAARAGALRADRRIHELAMRAGDVEDTDLCLAYGGIRPYRWRELVGEVVLGKVGQNSPATHRTKRAAARAWLNLLAACRAFRPHVLVASHPFLVTHAELPYLAPDTDWDAVAADTVRWAREMRGIDVAA